MKRTFAAAMTEEADASSSSSSDGSELFVPGKQVEVGGRFAMDENGEDCRECLLVGYCSVSKTLFLKSGEDFWMQIPLEQPENTIGWMDIPLLEVGVRQKELETGVFWYGSLSREKQRLLVLDRSKKKPLFTITTMEKDVIRFDSRRCGPFWLELRNVRRCGDACIIRRDVLDAPIAAMSAFGHGGLNWMDAVRWNGALRYGLGFEKDDKQTRSALVRLMLGGKLIWFPFATDALGRKFRGMQEKIKKIGGICAVQAMYRDALLIALLCFRAMGVPYDIAQHILMFVPGWQQEI